MSIITLARLSRPLRTSHTRSFSGINIIQDLKDTHNREITRFHHSYETRLSKLRKELKSLQRAKIKWERQDLQERRDEQKRWEQERILERSVEAQLMVWVSDYLERLMYCYAARQNQTSARGRQAQEGRVCYLFLAYVPLSLTRRYTHPVQTSSTLSTDDALILPARNPSFQQSSAHTPPPDA